MLWPPSPHFLNEMSRPLITLSSDFGPGNIGCGAMEAVIYEICPEAHVVHFCHTIEPYNIKEGARHLEGVAKIPVGFHVCVVDPGVGGKRKSIALQTKRGDFLIGPDNGVLIPASQFLGGIVATFVLENEEFFKKPVSPIFHGRDVFSPVAAHLAAGVSPKELGPKIAEEKWIRAPYENALWEGDQIRCEVLHINENGSLFLNVLIEEFQKKLKYGDRLDMFKLERKIASVSYQQTFGEVALDQPLILNDDFGRVEVAVNQGNFAKTFGVSRNEKLVLKKA